MKIVVGLGNPGREYAATRHNLGFMVVDEMGRRAAASGGRKRFRSEVVEGHLAGQKLVLVKPQTYMNLSGHAVREVLNWYHAPTDDLLIVYDDLDLPFGALRLRAAGSGGGHNGIRSVIEQLGTQAVPRLRVGIGRTGSPAVRQVLSRFAPDEARELPAIVQRAADAVACWVERGAIACMNDVNRRDTPGAPPPATDRADETRRPRDPDRDL
jgi:peptidyl-tRNA hydrolase, PTH1 family